MKSCVPRAFPPGSTRKAGKIDNLLPFEYIRFTLLEACHITLH